MIEDLDPTPEDRGDVVVETTAPPTPDAPPVTDKLDGELEETPEEKAEREKAEGRAQAMSARLCPFPAPVSR